MTEWFSSTVNKLISFLFPRKGLNQGENIAARYLKKQGHKIIERNYREKCGELDIISLDKNVLVFTEVKQRKNDLYGRPEDFITLSKRDKLRKTAQLYIMRKRHKGDVRFDVVEVLGEKKFEIRHIKNAF